MKIIGYHITEFTTKDNQNIKGVSFYCTMKPVSKGYFGEMCERVFVSDSKLPSDNFKVGDELEVYYNKFGKIHSVKIVSV